MLLFGVKFPRVLFNATTISRAKLNYFCCFFRVRWYYFHAVVRVMLHLLWIRKSHGGVCWNGSESLSIVIDWFVAANQIQQKLTSVAIELNVQHNLIISAYQWIGSGWAGSDFSVDVHRMREMHQTFKI